MRCRQLPLSLRWYVSKFQVTFELGAYMKFLRCLREDLKEGIAVSGNVKFPCINEDTWVRCKGDPLVSVYKPLHKSLQQWLEPYDHTQVDRRIAEDSLDAVIACLTAEMRTKGDRYTYRV